MRKKRPCVTFPLSIHSLPRSGYFLGPDYSNTPTFKWWVSTLSTLAQFFSLSTSASTDNEDNICPLDLDIYQQFYLGRMVHMCV